MIDVILLFGRLLLMGLLYLFLFAAVRAGLRAVNEARGKVAAPAAGLAAGLALAVTEGPAELLGVQVPLDGRIVIGRAPDADLVLGDDFVSTHHAAIAPADGAFVIEDLGSTNGTMLNGHSLHQPTRLAPGDVVEIGRVSMEVRRR